jgi:hypothetical protein
VNATVAPVDLDVDHDLLASTSLVDAYFAANPATYDYIVATLLGKQADGDTLVSEHMVPMVESIYRQIRALVDPATLNAAAARMYIEELGVFARHNAQFLKLAADQVSGFCPALAHELFRNFLEEGGEPGKVPAHYILYTTALLADLGLLVNGHLPAQETALLVLQHQVLVNSHMPSLIAGGYYATEGVAIVETEILYAVTDRYAELLGKGGIKELPNLTYYYDLHLDPEHEGAQVEGLSVEAAHIEGLAAFIRKSGVHNIDLPQVIEGWLQILRSMTNWWTRLAFRARDLK